MVFEPRARHNSKDKKQRKKEEKRIQTGKQRMLEKRTVFFKSQYMINVSEQNRFFSERNIIKLEILIKN